MIFTSDTPTDLRFVSVIPERNDKNELLLVQAYQELRDYLEQHQLYLFHERIYGLVSSMETVNAIRHEVFKKSNIQICPLTYVEGTPVDDVSVAGMHIIAVRGDQKTPLRDIQENSITLGQVYQGEEAEFLILSDIGRVLPEQSRKDRYTEATEAISKADKILQDQDWSFKDVFRTWFYLDDILDWYDEFNNARNKIYHHIGFMNGSINSVIPASTGIFGRNAAGYACTLDLLALRPLGDQTFHVERMVNPKQNEATEYGSAFSRGITITMQNSVYYFLSGTASIDEQGRTIHPDDMRKQTQRTLSNVKSLLENAGGGLQNIQQATAFIKRREDIPIFEEEIHRNGLADIPIIRTIADVCRDDLLVELDATAVMTKDSTEK